MKTWLEIINTNNEKVFIAGSLVAFVLIFNLGYVFHELIMGNFLNK
ncbi:MAG: hypothetical protein WDO19_06460 [Bacteroidota bacterium]